MNQSDITDFRTKRTAPVNGKARAILSTDIEQFLANGGKIETVPVGVSSEIYTGERLTGKQQRQKFKDLTFNILKDRNRGS